MQKFLQLFKKYQSHNNRKQNHSERKSMKNSKFYNSTPHIHLKLTPQPLKINVVNVFNHEEQVHKSTRNSNLHFNNSDKRILTFSELLQAPIVDIGQLRAEAWKGIPQSCRSLAWKILLQYCPTNQQNIQKSLKKKRTDYLSMVDIYIEHPALEQDGLERKAYKLINDDVMRTLPEIGLFRNEVVQRMMQRILYLWHIRHPSSGYVQGINDTVTPFIVVFLSEHVSINYATFDDPACLKVLPESTLAEVEADSYWCLCRMLDSLLDNYTDTWPGIEKSFGQLKEIILRVDPELLAHFEKEGIDFHHIYFKWVTCLLLRQFSVKIGLRLFDTYIADDGKYFNFVMFILAAIILKFSKKFKKMRFEDMMLFQQNMPTKEWSEEDLATVIAEAFVYQNYFPK